MKKHGGSPLGFRADVEGLRAVAVLMVLLYHLDVPWLTGGFAGVDVFFVISGFLITGLLAREIERSGRIHLLEFYARRAKRLFPAAGLVLATTAVATWGLLPSTRWQTIGGDIAASAGYLINWRLASRSVDYLAEDVLPSPVQHFWSLAVEEQYYIVWPLLLTAMLWGVGRWLKGRSLLLLVTAVVAVPSIVYSVIHTADSPSTAYFVTTTRMWELAMGAAVALTASYWSRLPRGAAMLLGWIGLAGIVASALVYSRQTAWPGSAALLPTLGTAAVIAAGFSAGVNGPLRLLALRPMVWIGGLSYSLYLWHWPLIQFAKSLRGEGLGSGESAVLAGISIALAWATLHLVENPARTSRRMHENPRYALGIGVVISLSGVLAGLLLYAAAQGRVRDMDQGRASVSALHPGAAAIKQAGGRDPALDAVDDPGNFVPTPEAATRDVPDAYKQGCQLSFEDAAPRTCISGVKGGRVKVALIGDSKAMQWLPALQSIAARNDWEIQINTKSSCGFHDRPSMNRDGTPYTECKAWNERLLPTILGDQRPDIAFVSMGGGASSENAEDVASFRRRWKQMSDAGTHVVVIANNPNPGRNIYECVATHPGKLTQCAFPNKAAPATSSMRAAATGMRGVTYLDLNDHICGQRTCAPVIGNVLIYRQGSHITATYAASLSSRIEKLLGDAGVIQSGKQSASTPPKPAPAVASDAGSAIMVEDVSLSGPYTQIFDRSKPDRNGVMTRRIRFGYQGQSRDETFKQVLADFAGSGYRPGKINERADGSVSTNLRHRNGQMIALSITPSGSGSGEGFLSIPRKPASASGRKTQRGR